MDELALRELGEFKARESKEANTETVSLPDRYSDTEWLAKGGMGSVYRAFDRPLSRQVAIKVGTNRRGHRNARQRFVAEAQTLAQLQHPGIPPVFELGRPDEEQPFIAMKLVRGETLTELFKQRSSPDDRLAFFMGVFRQVCETMAYAHSQEVIHRDLKPDNIMVGEFGEVQVMDWGLAKRLHDSDPETVDQRDLCEQIHNEITAGRSTTVSEIDFDAPWMVTEVCTEDGTVMGTAPYMSPEQAYGCLADIDERADVFALGAILCEILTGAPPTTARNSWQFRELMADGELQRVQERLKDVTVDQRLRDLCMRCLKQDTEGRPRSAADLAEELREQAETMQDRLHAMEVERISQAAERQVQVQRRRSRIVSAAGVCVICLISFAAWSFLSLQEAERRHDVETRFATAVTEAHQLRDRALTQPRNSEEVWYAAERSMQMASRLAAELEDSDRDAAGKLAAAIRTESQDASADRLLLSQLIGAQTPVRPAEMAAADGQPDPLRSGLGTPLFSSGPPSRLKPRHPPHGHGPSPIQSGIMDRARASVLAERHRAAFTNYGLNPLKSDPISAGRRMLARPDEVSEAILTGLDIWLGSLVQCRAPDDEETTWVAMLLDAMDPNPQRQSVRRFAIEGDAAALRQLALDPLMAEQPPGVVWIAAMLSEQPSVGIDLLQRAIAQHPYSALLHRELAEYHFRRGRLESAIGHLTAAAAIHADAFSMVRIGDLLIKTGNDDRALAYFDSAMRAAPNELEPYWSAAGLLSRLGRSSEAIDVLNQGLKLVDVDSPGYWMLLVRLGDLQDRAGCPQLAVNAFDRALKMEELPEPEWVRLTFRAIELEKQSRAAAEDAVSHDEPAT